MASYNKVILMGNLTRDPELRYTPSGAAVCEFTIAVNRKWRSKDGEAKEEVGFFDCVTWARSAEIASEYLKKGSLAFVEGRLTHDRWEQDGQKRNRIRITVERLQLMPNGQRSEARGGSRDDAGGSEEEGF